MDFRPTFYVNNILRAITHVRKKKTEANFNLQFDTFMVQNSFHPIYEISFKLLSFYTSYCSFPIQTNGNIVNRDSSSC